jgi:hypothetical protein
MSKVLGIEIWELDIIGCSEFGIWILFFISLSAVQ